MDRKRPDQDDPQGVKQGLMDFFGKFGKRAAERKQAQPAPAAPIKKEGSEGAKAFVKGFKKALD